MLAQMLQDDRSDEVRSSVVRSLPLIIIFITDPTKYKKVKKLNYDVVDKTKNNNRPFVTPCVEHELSPQS